MARRLLYSFLILLAGCLFISIEGPEAHAEHFIQHRLHFFEEGVHPDFSLQEHGDNDRPQNLYCRLRTRADVQQNHYLFAYHTAAALSQLRVRPEEPTSVRILTSNAYFRSFLKRLLFPKHGFW